MFVCFRCDLWAMIDTLTNRLRRIDKMKLITEDVVLIIHKHFQEVREYRKRQVSKVALNVTLHVSDVNQYLSKPFYFFEIYNYPFKKVR